MDPAPERFRRLARSAPYRWRSLLLAGTWGPRDDPHRVWVEQPDRLRVEHLDGALLFDGRQGSLGSGAVLTSDGSHVPYVPEPPAVERDEDGLVVTTRRPWSDGPELPMWQDSRFVAVLDAYEPSDGVEVLSADGADHDLEVLRPGDHPDDHVRHARRVGRDHRNERERRSTPRSRQTPAADGGGTSPRLG